MYVHAKLLQLCPVLCDPTDCSPLGSSVYGILQARLLESVAIPRWLSGKESTCNVGDAGSTPGSGSSPGEGNGPSPILMLGKSHGQRSLVGYS